MIFNNWILYGLFSHLFKRKFFNIIKLKRFKQIRPYQDNGVFKNSLMVRKWTFIKKLINKRILQNPIQQSQNFQIFRNLRRGDLCIFINTLEKQLIVELR